MNKGASLENVKRLPEQKQRDGISACHLANHAETEVSPYNGHFNCVWALTPKGLDV